MPTLFTKQSLTYISAIYSYYKQFAKIKNGNCISKAFLHPSYMSFVPDIRIRKYFGTKCITFSCEEHAGFCVFRIYEDVERVVNTFYAYDSDYSFLISERSINDWTSLTSSSGLCAMIVTQQYPAKLKKIIKLPSYWK